MRRTKKIPGQEILAPYSVLKEAVGSSSSGGVVAPEKGNVLQVGSTTAEYLKQTCKDEVDLRITSSSNVATTSGIGTVQVDTSESSDDEENLREENEEQQIQEGVGAMAGALNLVTSKMQNIVKILGEEQDNLHDEINSLIEGAKTAILTTNIAHDTTTNMEPASMTQFNQQAPDNRSPRQRKLDEQVKKYEAEVARKKKVVEKNGVDPRDPSFKYFNLVPPGQIAHPGCASPRRHFRDWKRDGFWCTCGRPFPSLYQLDRHLKNSVEPTLKAICTECDFTGMGQCCVIYHEREIHPTPTPEGYQCRFGCGKWFCSKLEMRNHQKETDRACKHKNATRLPPKPLPSGMLELAKMLGDQYNKVDGATGKETFLGNIKSIVNGIGIVAHDRQSTVDELNILEATIKDAAKIALKTPEEASDTLVAGFANSNKSAPEKIIEKGQDVKIS